MIICRWQHNATRVQFPADFSLHRYSKKFLPRRGSERLSHIYIYIAAFHTAPITSTQSVKLSTFFSTRVPHALPLFFFFFSLNKTNISPIHLENTDSISFRNTREQQSEQWSSKRFFEQNCSFYPMIKKFDGQHSFTRWILRSRRRRYDCIPAMRNTDKRWTESCTRERATWVEKVGGRRGKAPD